MIELPFSQACENNKAPILQHLRELFTSVSTVLEIGSGTGQHAAHFSENLPHLNWQPSDQVQYLKAVRLWREYSGRSNFLEPVELDVRKEEWPESFDAVYSANTAHIMSWETAQTMLRVVAEKLPVNGVFVLYGPFNYKGEFTSASNANFDEYLKSVDPLQGIRDFEAVNEIITSGGMALIGDFPMPANNRLLAWKKD